MPNAERPGLDRFTKRYLAALAVVAAALLAWWIGGLDSRVNELNDILRSDPTLSSYPYEFKVISLKNGEAVMSSPRSAQVPVMQFLRIVYPELNNAGVTDDAMMAAQDALAGVQSHAAALVKRQRDVDSIRWEIDRTWYAYHGVYLD